jgi:hypothetical protein
MRRTMLRVFDERKAFPVSGRGWVVERTMMPTRNHGSDLVWVKHFGSEREARRFFAKKGGR